MGKTLVTGNVSLFIGRLYIVILIFIPTLISMVYGTQSLREIKLLSFVDEIVYLLMIMTILYRLMVKKAAFQYIVLVYFLYSVFLIFKNDLPLKHIIQIYITVKCFIAFYYFNTMPEELKDEMLVRIVRLILIIFVISTVVTMVEFINPDLIHNLTHPKIENRGFFGTGVSSFATSRVLYSEFILLFLVVYYIFSHEKKYKDILPDFFVKVVPIFTGFFLLAATTCRKEMAIGFIIFPYLFYLRFKGIAKMIINNLFIIFAIIMAYVMINVFRDVNAVALSDKYVRLYLMLTAFRIFFDYFPFGSGPGTYGSTFSQGYLAIYEKYNVGKQILGWDEATRGPIYDMFATSLLAEYGLGIIIFFIWGYQIYKTNIRGSGLLVARVHDISQLKKYFMLLIVLLSVFTPIFTNWIGVIIFTILGLVNERQT